MQPKGTRSYYLCSCASTTVLLPFIIFIIQHCANTQCQFFFICEELMKKNCFKIYVHIYMYMLLHTILVILQPRLSKEESMIHVFLWHRSTDEQTDRLIVSNYRRPFIPENSLNFKGKEKEWNMDRRAGDPSTCSLKLTEQNTITSYCYFKLIFCERIIFCRSIRPFYAVTSED